MSEQDYFKNAISNFTFETASGGAIRHMADLGHTIKQITQKLSFPTPYERVQRAVWEHLLDTGVLLLEEPGSGKSRERVSYVRDYDKYGKPSFRRVVLPDDSKEVLCWKEKYFGGGAGSERAALLREKCDENGYETSYVSCDFGLRVKREPERFAQSLQALEEDWRDYILGLPWERRIIFHRLDGRMREIIVRLYENGDFQGNCFFMKTEEKIVIGRKEEGAEKHC